MEFDLENVDKKTVLGYGPRIPWEKFSGPGMFLLDEDVRIIKRFRDEEQSAMVELLATEEDARRYPYTLMKMLIGITDVRMVQYALALIDEFLGYDPAARAQFFAQPGDAEGRLFFLPFLQLVGTANSGARLKTMEANAFIVERAAQCAAYMLSVDSSDTMALASLLAWVMEHLKNYGSSIQKQIKITEVAVTTLTVLLRNDYLRSVFTSEGGAERLIPIVATRNTQVLYEVLLCLWALSLKGEHCQVLERAGAVPAIASAFRLGMPLKVLRMAAATLAAIAKQPECVDSLSLMCETHLSEVLETMLTAENKLADGEALEDMTWLREALKTNKRRLTSLERYEKDVIARRFEWTAVHSAEFWKENSQKFEADEFALLKQVGALLASPMEVDDTTLAVALFDLGEFAVNHPQGRNLLQHLGIRAYAMALLKHENEEVKAQALLACSKMMISKWEFVSGGNKAATPTAAAAK